MSALSEPTDPASPPMIPPLVSGLGALAPHFDAVILDLWGVIHDGTRLFEEVPACLEQLRAHGKTICLLSNAPRRIASVEAKLRSLGLPGSAYDVVLSSGEATHLALRHPPDAWHAGLGAHVYHLGPERDDDVLDDLDLIRVETPEQADFVLNTGIDAPTETLADYEPILTRCLKARLPMICANPDLIVTVGDTMAICAGALAEPYAARGGDVRYHGKPHAPIYELMFRQAGLDNAKRVVAVGDSLRTDIAGARAAGMPSILVTSGIHREELGAAWGERPNVEALEAVLRSAPARPDYLMTALRW